MENTRTINGLNVKEFTEKIESNFPDHLIDRDQNGHPYFPAWAYQNRLNEIVGIFNYDFSVTSHKLVELKDKLYVTTIGKLVIKYDDGTPALVREAEGGAEVIILKTSGQPKDLTDNIKSAGTDAFKVCCRKLGMAEKQLQNLKKNNKGQGGIQGNNQGGNKNNGNGNNKPANNNIPEEEYKVVITDKFTSLNGKGYKAPAKDVKTNEVVSVVFWADAIQKVEEKMPMNKFMEAYVNKALSVVAQKSTYNGRNGAEIQLTVKGFPQSN